MPRAFALGLAASTRTSSSSALRRVVSFSTCAITITRRNARSCAVTPGSRHCVSTRVAAQPRVPASSATKGRSRESRGDGSQLLRRSRSSAPGGISEFYLLAPRRAPRERPGGRLARRPVLQLGWHPTRGSQRRARDATGTASATHAGRRLVMNAKLFVAPSSGPQHGSLVRPVFLVQGFGSSVAALRPLERSMHRLGRPTFCTSHSLGLGDLRHAAAHLHDMIEEVAAATSFERVDVVAHSMGGLVASYVLKRLDRGRRVSRVVALGTPFRGLSAARYAAWLLGPFACSLRQITPGSSLLQLLARLPVPPGSALVSVAGTRDRLVPRETTRLPATPRHLHLDAVGLDHFDLLLRKRSFALVEQALEAPHREAPLPLAVRRAA